MPFAVRNGPGVLNIVEFYPVTAAFKRAGTTGKPPGFR
jgi:hypothetical protein